MRAVVTGAAGFIGSHLAEYLVERGHEVVGVDAFTPYYDPRRKEGHLARLRDESRFTLLRADLAECSLDEVVDGADVVYHLAGQPGVRASWADGFNDYLIWNVLATQRLLESCRAHRVPRLVYASSSSLYGNAERYPTTEDDVPAPHSPYGVTKLAGEHLCRLYARNFGAGTVALRYFTVFGPRQRPDLAMMRIIDEALSGGVFTLFGSGDQVRDFTFVDDVVAATAACGWQALPPGSVFNVAGGSPASMNQVLDILRELLGARLTVERGDPMPGDVSRTGGSTHRIQAALGWVPRVTLREGLERQVAWALDRRSAQETTDGTEAA